MDRKITFITGGARSGKSTLALSLASNIAGRKAYIATCEPLDEEMRERIERHRAERSEDWETFEEPVDISALIRDISGKYEAVLIDCLTLWLSNVIGRGLDAGEMSQELTQSLDGASCNVIVVSNEVGMGIVPEGELSRRFRDMAGRLNQIVAAVADEVYLSVSGIPIKIKGR